MEKELKEKNIALREVLDQIQKEKQAIEERMASTSELLLLPLLEKMKSKGSELDDVYLELIENTINNITSSFASNIERANHKLSAREIEICTMIKNGLTTMEIAKAMDLSFRTVETHRNNIRKKLDIKGKNINLLTYLKSLQ